MLNNAPTEKKPRHSTLKLLSEKEKKREYKDLFVGFRQVQVQGVRSGPGLGAYDQSIIPTAALFFLLACSV